MMRVHPDIGISHKNSYAYTAQEINIAYSILKKHEFPDNVEKSHTSGTWNAPLNPNAYITREILHPVEDYDGTILGNICIAKGKYLWTTEEDFSLFLLSLYNCSKQLLDDIDSHLPQKADPAVRQQFQAELSYLLAQQFIDGTSLLSAFAKRSNVDQDGNLIYYMSAMLEPTVSAKALFAALSQSEVLYPSRVWHHRLYLKSKTGNEIGYLSFPDDRLYYIVIPLFEQKRAQVKIQVTDPANLSGSAFGSSPRSHRQQHSLSRYYPLHLWVRIPAARTDTMPESLTLQIQHLLERYRSHHK
jgi:hypothetical protein